MKKKLMAMLLSMTLLGSLAGCGVSTTAPGGTDEKSSSSSDSKDTKSGGKTIGILMPTKSSERWINDGNDMVKGLKALGYATDLQYAEDVVETQVSQAENLITKGVSALVIANIDGESLTDVCKKAKDAGIPVIAYDRLIKNTENVDYYISFDNTLVGVQIGQYIEKSLDLKNAGSKSYNIELFAGSPDDNNAHMLYDGAMSVLKPYIDSKKLTVVSGQTSFDEVCTLRWDGALAQARMENILTANYSAGKKVDAVFSSYDGLSRGIVEALRSVGYGSADLPWPIITGQDAETATVKSIIAGEQTQTIFKDTRKLADQAVKTVDAVLKGEKAEVNDEKTYNNGVKVVPSYLCTPVSVDAKNYKEVLIDSGYLKQADLDKK